MNASSLINFLNKLESKGVISNKANDKIQNHISYNTNFFGKLFLVLCAVIGALFAGASIFEFIVHNWDDLPKHVRGVMSIIPLLVALYFYYLAIFKHKNSVSWIEASSVFLFLMIGASIALVSSTYQLNGDFDTFMIVWLLLTVPLFYIARASGIAILYMFLALYFVYPPIAYLLGQGWSVLFREGDNYLLFWMFFFLFLPHFFMTLNHKSRRQSMRSVYLGYVIIIGLNAGLTQGIKGGFIWWSIAVLLLAMVAGNRFFGQNWTIWGKPFQAVSLYFLFFTLLGGSGEYGMRLLFEAENLNYFSDWDNTVKLHYILGFLMMVGATILAWKTIRTKSIIHKSITYLPILVLFLMLLHYINNLYAVDLTWIGRLVMNIFVLVFGIAALMMGNKQKNMPAMFYGLFLICALLWIRYFDMDIAFWLKGFIFLGVAGMFFFIHFVFAEDVDNTLGHVSVSNDPTPLPVSDDSGSQEINEPVSEDSKTEEE